MKRTKEDIVAEVLEICIGGANKTAIVYKANLNFHTVGNYINLLIERQMLEKIYSHPITYRTTSNGIKLMEELKSIRSKIPEIYNIPVSGKSLAQS